MSILLILVLSFAVSYSNENIKNKAEAKIKTCIEKSKIDQTDPALCVENKDLKSATLK